MVKISETLAKFRTWFASLWTAKNRDALLAVLDHVSVFVDVALPIVEAIDKELKPALRTGHYTVVKSVDDFLRTHMESEHYDEIAKCSLRVAHMPLPDLAVNVALFMLQRARPESVGVSILRLAIELAYNVYKRSKKNEA